MSPKLTKWQTPEQGDRSNAPIEYAHAFYICGDFVTLATVAAKEKLTRRVYQFVVGNPADFQAFKPPAMERTFL